MSFSGKKKETSPVSPLNKRRASWSELWVNHHHHHLLSPPPRIPKSDLTLLLSDPTLLTIIAKVPSPHRKTLSLVCKRWLRLHGTLVRSIKVSDWGVLESGRVVSRFPNLDNVDLVVGRCGGLVSFTVGVGCYQSVDFIEEERPLSAEIVDRGLRVLASGCSSLRRLVVANASELGLLSVAEECTKLQELELHKCCDNVLLGVGAFENLQILRLVGLVSDIGLMIVAQGCKRLVKLELVGCRGGFDGVKEIGECCQMLEEFSVCDHKMEAGWLGGLGYCENLKTLRLVSCKKIDCGFGLGECLSRSCPALERLHLEKCQLREKDAVKALFKMCEAAREIVFQDCWGLDDDIFSLAMALRY